MYTEDYRELIAIIVLDLARRNIGAIGEYERFLKDEFPNRSEVISYLITNLTNLGYIGNQTIGIVQAEQMKALQKRTRESALEIVRTSQGPLIHHPYFTPVVDPDGGNVNPNPGTGGSTGGSTGGGTTGGNTGSSSTGGSTTTEPVLEMRVSPTSIYQADVDLNDGFDVNVYLGGTGATSATVSASLSGTDSNSFRIDGVRNVSTSKQVRWIVDFRFTQVHSGYRYATLNITASSGSTSKSASVRIEVKTS